MAFKKIYILSLLLLFSACIYAQSSPIYYEAGTSGIASTGDAAPLWLHTNQYGMYSASPFGSTTYVGVGKELEEGKKLFKYAFKANGQFRIDDAGGRFYLHELYAKIRLGAFDLNVGSKKEFLGNQDPILSSGGFLFSTNARPMPKITVGIEEFTAIPYTKGYVEVKGAISQGWFNDPRYIDNAMLHHKYAYIRLGGDFLLNFQYGIEHAAQWGGTHPVYGKQSTGFKDFVRVFFGKSGGDNSNPNEVNNALGNHIISQSMRLDFKLSGYAVGFYWQNLNEDPPIKFMWKSMNRPDGLWGIVFRNSHFPYISGVLYEYLNTSDQSGPYHDKDGIIYGGNDSYFANFIYKSGWSYFARTIGTPFITPPYENANGTFTAYNDRVRVHHFGINGDIEGYRYRMLASVSKSYGTYNIPFAETMKCTSLMLEVNKQFPRLWNLEFGCTLAADFGKLPIVDYNNVRQGGNSFGALITIRKRGILFKLK